MGELACDLTPLVVLQELAAWETERMVRHYAHLATYHLAVYPNGLEAQAQSW